MQNKTCKLIQAWQSYLCLGTYLTQVQKIKISATNSIIKSLTQNFIFWSTLQLTNNGKSQIFISHLKWFSKYLRKCGCKHVTISLYDLNPLYVTEVMNMFLEGTVESVEKLDIYCESEDIHLAASLCFLNLQELTLRSRCVTNELVKVMADSLKCLHSLVVIKNDLQFSCENLAHYILNPMQKLVIKPYVIQFAELVKIAERSAKTLLELQIDVEECEIETIIEIIKPLRQLERLRLYHLQNFQNDEVLYQVMKNQQKILQLSLTKTYNISLSLILQAITSQHLRIIDLSDSKYLNDQDIIMLSKGAYKLKQINISWCNGVTSDGLIMLIQNCLDVEILNITGIKESRDVIFGEEYNLLMEEFDEKKFNIAKNMIVGCKKLEERESYYDISNYFKTQPPIPKGKILKKLKVLNCQSCNGISDNILKIIFILNPRIRAFNYYGNYMGLLPNDNQSTFC